MNEQTLPILQRVLDDYDSKKVYYDVISQQIMQETEEFIIDRKLSCVQFAHECGFNRRVFPVYYTTHDLAVSHSGYIPA